MTILLTCSLISFEDFRLGNTKGCRSLAYYHYDAVMGLALLPGKAAGPRPCGHCSWGSCPVLCV